MAKVQLSISMELSLFLKLDHYCEKNNLRRSHVIEAALKEYLNKREKE